ncbi:MAG: hypothetical protein ACPGYV_00110 [Phycisphaeraceae bacterium]
MTQPKGYNPDETHVEDGLPRERLRAVRPRTLVIEWVIALGVLLAINFAAFALLDRFDPNRFRVQVEVKYDRLETAGAKYDSLILGDSTPNQGIMPSVLGKRVGGAWLNLATVADLQAVNGAWMLGRYIDAYGPPKRVILCHVPEMWRRDLDPAAFVQTPFSIGQFDELDPPLNFAWDDRLWGAVTRYAPIYSKNTSLTEFAMKPWALRDLREDFQADGFMAVEGMTSEWAESIERAAQSHAEKPYALSEHNRVAMERMIEMAETHGFDLYLLPGSVSEALAASPGYRHNFVGMMADYQRWAASSDRVVLLSDRMQAFPDEMMYDEDHVNVLGAQAWSERAAAYLAEVIDASAIEEVTP